MGTATAARHLIASGAATSEPLSTLVLVDFDNLFPQTVRESELRHVLMRLVELSVATSTDTTVSIRLYGGWTSNGILSRRGSEVALAVSQADPFPMVIRGDVIRGSVELAMSLMSEPSIIFDDTYRRRAAAPRLRLSESPPAGCADSETCPAKILTRFTKGPGRTCPTASCSVSAGSAFVVHEQKMVDTMLSCDLIQGSLDDAIRSILVVSDDTDFVPPLLASAQLCKGAIAVLAPNGTLNESMQALLKSKGVRMFSLEAHDGTV